VSFQGSLQASDNEILVRFEEVAARECPYALALQIVPRASTEQALDGLSVLVPTTVEWTARRQMYERAFDQAYLEHDVSLQGADVALHWVDDLDTGCNYTVRLQDWRNRIYAEGAPQAEAGAVLDLGSQSRLSEGPHRIVLMPPVQEYYERNVRTQRHIPFHVLAHTYSEGFYGDYEQRRREALEDAIRRENGLYSEIAKYALGRWASVDRDVIQEAMQGINQRGDCSDFYMVGLLGILYRYSKGHALPEALKRPLEQCVLNFKYWHDEPGSDAMCYTTENHSILFHTCEVLAGQLYPDRTFSNTGHSGTWHREKGERLALDWLRQRGTTGFTEWDSNCYFEEDLLALSHLTDLAESTEVRELAAVVMDKMFFTLALNSFKGTFGSTHGRTYAALIKSGQREATSGITRLMWGMGVWNDHIRGTVALACSDYELPSPIAAVALDLIQELWDKEQHGVDGGPSVPVNKVTYRTKDFMLCSAQDYRPGEKGYQQHIWQATMGPDAVVFVTHPPCMSEEGAHRPNFWHGNYVLPRVAQWKDVLVAVHSLPEDDWMGFTHAYWPAYEFDEQTVDDNWAFARKGEGYLALAATQGLEQVKRGPSAYRELRSCGQDNVWLCMMGRQETDGSFEEFQNAVRALDVDLREQGVSCTTLRGEALSFGWEGPLLVDGEEQPLSGFKHYENPYCVAEVGASQMDIQWGEYIVRLHFEPGEQGSQTG
jgi:hypothetical protein